MRVTDRPRPPADLLPRPAILVKAMREAQRSTGPAGRGRRRQRGKKAQPAANGNVSFWRIVMGDLRYRIRLCSLVYDL